VSFYVQLQFIFLLHCDEWDRFVVPPRHKFVTGATLLQLEWQIRCFPCGKRSDVPWLQQVKQKAVGRQMNQIQVTSAPGHFGT
jgi:hypothetical protein